MHRSIVLAAPFVLLVACGGQGPSESLSESEQALKRFGMEGDEPVRVSADSGVADTKPDTAPDTSSDTGTGKGLLAQPLATVFENSIPPAPCTRVRYDIRTSAGRSCTDLTKTTSTGTWTAVPIFPDAPPESEISRTFCAATWVPNSPTCAAPDLAVLNLTCLEDKWKVRRSASCAADASACASSGSATALSTPLVAKGTYSCEGGVLYGGWVGGCDSCAEIYGGQLYITNPYDWETLFTNVPIPGSDAVTPIEIQVAPHTTTVIPDVVYPNNRLTVWY